MPGAQGGELSCVRRRCALCHSIVTGLWFYPRFMGDVIIIRYADDITNKCAGSLTSRLLHKITKVAAALQVAAALGRRGA